MSSGQTDHRQVDGRPVLVFVCATGISVNEMVWISGTSVGTALFSAVAASRSSAPKAVNPLHAGPGVGYSDAFLSLAVPLLVLLAFSSMLRGVGGKPRR